MYSIDKEGCHLRASFWRINERKLNLGRGLLLLLSLLSKYKCDAIRV